MKNKPMYLTLVPEGLRNTEKEREREKVGEEKGLSPSLSPHFLGPLEPGYMYLAHLMNFSINHKNYNFLEFDWSINLCILF